MSDIDQKVAILIAAIRAVNPGMSGSTAEHQAEMYIIDGVRGMVIHDDVYKAVSLIRSIACSRELAV